MKHLLCATTPVIAFSTDEGARRGCGQQWALRDRPTTKLALTLRIVGVAALVAASVTAIADQSARFVGGQELAGVHGIPAFVSGRVELTPGLSVDDLALDAGCGPSGRGAPADLPACTGTAQRRP